METISTRCNGTIQDLDRPQELEIFQRTSQVKWITGQMIFEAAGLQLHSMAYSRKNEHEGRHLVKKRLSKHERG